MPVLVTGAAGFLGHHVSAALLDRGEAVVGVDDLNPYYDVALKRARLARLAPRPGFAFVQGDLALPETLAGLCAGHPGIDRIVHLAAQAGVRHALEDPRAYGRSNLVGHLEILETARALPGLRHLVYASSSSVYGGNTKRPYAVADPVDAPVSLYAATKRADELMSRSYAHLFGLRQTGLRFFTVYGPWGRPDMAYYLFARAIAEGRPIRLFNRGRMERDFTYVDDAVAGVLAALDRPPPADAGPPHRLYNIGNSRPEQVPRLLRLLEEGLGRTAIVEAVGMQPGDVEATYADIADTTRDLGWSPTTGLDEGIARFLAWFRTYHRS